MSEFSVDALFDSGLDLYDVYVKSALQIVDSHQSVKRFVFHPLMFELFENQPDN